MAEINLHHHGSNHEPDQHGDGHIDVAGLSKFQAADGLDGGRQHLAEDDAGRHAEGDPD
jgi:hypothetical protein